MTTSDFRTDRTEVAVVGGGLAGLATATYLARAGVRVALFERGASLGGRARTRVQEDFHLNQGPHALYRRGAADRVLTELGIPFSGGRPDLKRSVGWRGGRLARLPLGLLSLATTPLVPWRAKPALARVLGSLGEQTASSRTGQSVAEWLTAERLPSEVRAFMEAFVRLTTYAHAPAEQDAGAALRQLQLGRAGVLYLDGGWQTLVDGLAKAAEEAGAVLVPHASVQSIEYEGQVNGVTLEDGRRCAAETVVLAVPPGAARTVLGHALPARRRPIFEARPVRAACLDIALRFLPRPERTFLLGVDRPLYVSLHSSAARLAPPGRWLLQAARYLGPDEKVDAEALRGELRKALDQLQPGWSEAVIIERFVPELVVAQALVEARRGGFAGRPASRMPEVPGVYLAGDWVGPEGLLADASLASARRAAMDVLADRTSQREPTARRAAEVPLRVGA
jgi:phytoene dehydrogenase-like protein